MPDRQLLITADDFGIGPETTRGILAAARRGAVTSSVLLVNSPYAVEAVRAWEAAGRPIELGWHPCLTLDAPLSPPGQVPSLIGPDGRFHPLGRFLRRILLDRIKPAEVAVEFRAQLDRFIEIVGQPPMNVNAHHHVHVFTVVSLALARVLAEFEVRPYVRRVVECAGTLRSIPGARLKRLFLTLRGRQAARCQFASGFAGNHFLIGVTDPKYVADPTFFLRWLRASQGERVELACHPGYADQSLAGRDDDLLQRRKQELDRLLDPKFLEAVRELDFRLVTAAQMAQTTTHTATPARRRHENAAVRKKQRSQPR